jgi:hypothetical protein
VSDEPQKVDIPAPKDRRKGRQVGRQPGQGSKRGTPVWPCGTVDQARELCGGIAAVTLRQLVQKGVLPRPERAGWYHLPTTVAAYFDYTMGTQGEGDDINTAKLRFWRAKGRHEELDAEQLDGRLIPLERAEAVQDEVLAELAGEMDGMAGKLAAELAGSRDIAFCRRRMLEEFRGARARAAAKVDRLRAAGEPPQEPREDGLDAAADEDGG